MWVHGFFHIPFLEGGIWIWWLTWMPGGTSLYDSTVSSTYYFLEVGIWIWTLTWTPGGITASEASTWFLSYTILGSGIWIWTLTWTPGGTPLGDSMDSFLYNLWINENQGGSEAVALVSYPGDWSKGYGCCPQTSFKVRNWISKAESERSVDSDRFSPDDLRSFRVGDLRFLTGENRRKIDIRGLILTECIRSNHTEHNTYTRILIDNVLDTMTNTKTMCLCS